MSRSSRSREAGRRALKVGVAIVALTGAFALLSEVTEGVLAASLGMSSTGASLAFAVAISVLMLPFERGVRRLLRPDAEGDRSGFSTENGPSGDSAST